MRIQELIEAVAPVGTTTDQVSANGLTPTAPPPTTNPGQTPPPGQQTPPTTSGQTPPPVQSQDAGQAEPRVGNQPPAPIQDPAMQQGMKDTMTDLDKIAAQIVGLKQKQQQMQQQMQQQI